MMNHTTSSVLLIVTLIVSLNIASLAQQAGETRILLREQALLREGPGHTYQDITQLNGNDALTITARNEAGTWVKLQVERGTDTAFEGWAFAGFLVLDDLIYFSETPVDATMPDADPTRVNSATMAQLYRIPVLSEVSEAMREVYERGQEMGNHNNVVTKVGDSLSASRIYLQPFGQDNFELGPYDHLETTINHFGTSMGTPSVAAIIGMSSLVVFDPFWADAERCEPNETPLACEYRLKQPTIAAIMFGPNDVRSMNRERYTAQMTRIVEETLAQGIIPVLSTFSADPDEELWWQALDFNLALAEIAETYEVPLINLWAAARPLPQYGLDNDNIHLKHSGYENIFFRNGHPAYYGVTLHNLLTITMIDRIRSTLHISDD